MFLKTISIENFRVLKDIEIQFEQEFTPTIFPLGSLNGGGKSTLLQLVFTLLHCSFKKQRHQYLVNLLSTITFTKRDTVTTLAKFEIKHDDKAFDLEFIVSDNHFEGQNLNVFLDVEELEQKLAENKALEAKYSSLLKLEEEINSSNRVSPLRWLEMSRYLNSKTDRELYEIARKNGSYDEYKKCLAHLLRSYKAMLNHDNDLELMLKEEQSKHSKIRHLLKSKEMLYVTHFDNEKVLLCQTNIDDTDILTKMSDKVYLAAPSTQVFLFLSAQEKETFFSKESGIINYIDYLNKAKEKLTGFFPYDFASSDLIIKSFEKARDKDFEEALENGKYGEHFKKLTTALNRFLIDKTITVNKQLSNIVFKLENNEEALLPEDLSHGELKKLGIYIWLNHYGIEDSLVLMDEIEIGLHPDWQYEIVNELQEWSKNNQFILATHSYELCQALTPSHVKELEPKLIKTNKK
ncbi:MAG TPA: ATP-binding protein [Thiotrichaceae bacterium]|nr:ATP-binding protein [Thiotrichaceae bacterium]